MLSLYVTRPEIDLQAAEDFERDCAIFLSSHLFPTSIDILEVEGETLRMQKDLNHDEVVDYVQRAQVRESKPSLVVFFLKTHPGGAARHYCLQAEPKTLIELQHAYDISPTFIYRSSYKFHSTFKPYLLTTKSRTEGTYCIGPALDGYHPMVQFKYDVSTKSSVYFVAHASTKMMRLIEDTSVSRISIPFFIDLLIFDYVLDNEIDVSFNGAKNEVLNFERGRDQPRRPANSTGDSLIRQMHSLAQQLATGTLNCEDFLINEISFLSSSIDRLGQINGISEEQLTYVSGILQAQERRAKTIHIWYQGYQKRLEVQINLAFNLIFQKDSETNVRIAKDTAKIALDAQRDSASMIIIAAVTMFFLPGTFVCAVFSMVFFNVEVDAETGNSTFLVSPRLWYFFAITAPLTIVVFVVWIFWTRQRRRAKEAQQVEVDQRYDIIGGTMPPPIPQIQQVSRAGYAHILGGLTDTAEVVWTRR